MTTDIALVLIIVVVAVILFISDKFRVDLVALMVLGSLVLTSLVTPVEALSGFSNPAVITVWAVFILSGGLSQTGVANVIGQQVMRLSGKGEIRLLLTIMLTAAILSAFMNNVGVAALLLPVVIDIARRTGQSPSRLLIPLAYGALLGGLTTLIGTPPNILASDALAAAGFEPFNFFDFAPVGLAVVIAGVAFMLFMGRSLLPRIDPSTSKTGKRPDLERIYNLQEQLLVLRLPQDSVLDGMSLARSQLGSLLDLNVLVIVREGQSLLSPGPEIELRSADQLLVLGKPDQLYELRRHRVDTVERTLLTVERVQAAGINVAEIELPQGSSLVDQTLAQANLRSYYGLNVLAIRRQGILHRTDLPRMNLQAGDHLIIQGRPEKLAYLLDDPSFIVTEVNPAEIAELEQRLLYVRLPKESSLVGRTLSDNRLGATFGLTVLSIARGNEVELLPDPSEIVEEGDLLLVQGAAENITALRGLEDLELDRSDLALETLRSARVGLAEVVLSPHTTLAGQTLRNLHFREKFGLNVLAIFRSGRSIVEDLPNIGLRFGDALLLYGLRDRLNVLGSEPDFLVLSEDAQPPPRLERAPISSIIMALVLLTVIVGWLPITVAAIIGGTFMILTGCLTMDEAYRYIEWPAVFLIACMLPLGIAMETSGAATYIAGWMLDSIGDLGPLVVLAGLFVMSVLATQVMPSAAVVVLMAPIALAASSDLNVSPQSFMMGVAIAASASFMSPVAHPANVLVMGPGGYRFSDYIKVGLPLTIVVLFVVLLVLPHIWPFIG